MLAWFASQPLFLPRSPERAVLDLDAESAPQHSALSTSAFSHALSDAFTNGYLGSNADTDSNSLSGYGLPSGVSDAQGRLWNASAQTGMAKPQPTISRASSETLALPPPLLPPSPPPSADEVDRSDGLELTVHPLPLMPKPTKPKMALITSHFAADPDLGQFMAAMVAPRHGHSSLRSMRKQDLSKLANHPDVERLNGGVGSAPDGQHLSTIETALDHYTEIEAAIVANLLNTAFGEVWLIYDSVHHGDNCTHLTKRLRTASDTAFGHWGVKKRPLARLNCVERSRTQGQPSYHEMFEYARTLDIHSDVAVMANADGATDSSISQLAAIHPGMVVMLSVTGWGEDSERDEEHRRVLVSTPSNKQVYEALVGTLCDPRPISRCLRTWEQRNVSALRDFFGGKPDEWKFFRWPEQMLSWDAYVFRPASLPKLSEVILPPSVTMNMIGAENRAGLALLDALGPKALIFNETLPNACGHVTWNHFHCGQKFHGNTGPVATAGMSKRDWHHGFGDKRPYPQESALVQGTAQITGIDGDLELTVEELLVASTSGCVDIRTCLSGSLRCPRPHPAHRTQV